MAMDTMTVLDYVEKVKKIPESQAITDPAKSEQLKLLGLRELKVTTFS